jgi:hypothetical protein
MNHPLPLNNCFQTSRELVWCPVDWRLFYYQPLSIQWCRKDLSSFTDWIYKRIVCREVCLGFQKREEVCFVIEVYQGRQLILLGDLQWNWVYTEYLRNHHQPRVKLMVVAARCNPTCSCQSQGSRCMQVDNFKNHRLNEHFYRFGPPNVKRRIINIDLRMRVWNVFVGTLCESNLPYRGTKSWRSNRSISDKPSNRVSTSRAIWIRAFDLYLSAPERHLGSSEEWTKGKKSS